jgi:hypothetical protein
MLAMVSTTDTLFCTFTKSGGYSAAEQLASLQGCHLVSSIKARRLMTSSLLDSELKEA